VKTPTLGSTHVDLHDTSCVSQMQEIITKLCYYEIKCFHLVQISATFLFRLNGRSIYVTT